MPPLTCTHGNWLNSSRGVIDVIIGRVFVVLARFLATDVVTLLCSTALDMFSSCGLLNQDNNVSTKAIRLLKKIEHSWGSVARSE